MTQQTMFPSNQLPLRRDFGRELRRKLDDPTLSRAFGGFYWAMRAGQLVDPLLLNISAIFEDEGIVDNQAEGILGLMRVRLLDDLVTRGEVIGDVHLSAKGWSRVGRYNSMLESQLRRLPNWKLPTADDEGYPTWNPENAEHEMAIMAALVRAAL